jgi:uncharacterized protein (TIGR02147 family)
MFVGSVLKVFLFDNYRTYLKEYYAAAKAKDAKYSFRYFARIVGSKNPSFMKQVIDGKRNLTPQQVESFIRNMKLGNEESYFFRNLVALNQAKSAETRELYARRILLSRSYQKLHPLSLAQYDYLSYWFYVPIRELVALKGFEEDPEWIAKHLKFPVPPQQIRSAINKMLKLGVLKRDNKGRLRQAEANITTLDGILSTALARVHQELILRGAESIDRIPRTEREIFGLTFTLHASVLPTVKEKIANFRREMVELLSADVSPDSNRVYQFHFLLFPMAEIGLEAGGE